MELAKEHVTFVKMKVSNDKVERVCAQILRLLGWMKIKLSIVHSFGRRAQRIVGKA